MKKTSILAMLLTIALCLTSCGNDTSGSTAKSAGSTTTENASGTSYLPENNLSPAEKLFIEQHVNFISSEDYSNLKSGNFGSSQQLADLDSDNPYGDQDYLISLLRDDIENDKKIKLYDTIPDSVFNLITEEIHKNKVDDEYVILIGQLLCNDEVYEGITDFTCLALDNSAYTIMNNLLSVVSAIPKNQLSEAEKTAFQDLTDFQAKWARKMDAASMDQLLMGSDEYFSLMQEYKDEINTLSEIDGFDVLSNTDKLLKGFEKEAYFAGVISNVTDSLSDAITYSCLAEAYFESTDSFKEVLYQMKQIAHTTSALGAEEPTKIDAAIDFYMNELAQYNENQAADALLNYLAVTFTKATVMDLVKDQIYSGIPVLGQIDYALSVFKMSLRNASENTGEDIAAASVSATMVQKAYNLAHICETVMESNGKNVRLVNDQLERNSLTASYDGLYDTTLLFDESVNIYRNIESLICDYGIDYYENSGYQRTASLQDKRYLRLGKTVGYWYLDFHRNDFQSIRCHLTNEAYLQSLIEAQYGECLAFYYDDYDYNGSYEAYAVIGEINGEDLADATVVFISDEGSMTEAVHYDKVIGYGEGRNRSQELAIMDTGYSKYFTFAGIDGQAEYLFGVKNGVSYEPIVSGQYAAFYQDSEDETQYIGENTDSDVLHYYVFNSETWEFENISSIDVVPYLYEHSLEELADLLDIPYSDDSYSGVQIWEGSDITLEEGESINEARSEGNPILTLYGAATGDNVDEVLELWGQSYRVIVGEEENNEYTNGPSVFCCLNEDSEDRGSYIRLWYDSDRCITDWYISTYIFHEYLESIEEECINYAAVLDRTEGFSTGLIHFSVQDMRTADQKSNDIDFSSLLNYYKTATYDEYSYWEICIEDDGYANLGLYTHNDKTGDDNAGYYDGFTLQNGQDTYTGDVEGHNYKIELSDSYFTISILDGYFAGETIKFAR